MDLAKIVNNDWHKIEGNDATVTYLSNIQKEDSENFKADCAQTVVVVGSWVLWVLSPG